MYAVLVGFVGGGSFVGEERKGERRNCCCCHCMLGYAVVVDGPGIVLGTRIVGEVGIRIVALRLVHLDMDLWAGCPSGLGMLAEKKFVGSRFPVLGDPRLCILGSSREAEWDNRWGIGLLKPSRGFGG